jgi:branched-chain amino acid transport system substrate-binding protein
VRLKRSACALLAVGVAAGFTAVSAGSAAAGGKAPTVKIILLAETTGESPAAVPYYNNGAQLAANELGSRVEFSRIAAPLTPAQAETALNQALDEDPDAIIGFPASSQTIAISQRILDAGIPFFSLSSGEQLVKNGPNGGKNLFLIRPVDTLVATAEAEYVVNDLKAKRIGLLCVDNATGVNGCNAAKKVIEPKRGVEIVAERTNSTTATDLTEQATAMEGADAILDFNFPNPIGVFAQQLVDNGIDVPHVDGASAGIAVASGSVTGEAATNLNGVDDCVPTISKNSKVKNWVADYEAEYGSTPPPNYSAAQSYDAVKLIAAAAKNAGSVAPAKLIKAIAAINYKGICADYKADNLNVLQHTADLTKFSAEGQVGIKKKLTFEPGALPGVVPETTIPPTTAAAAPPPSS